MPNAVEVGAFGALLTVLGDQDGRTAWGQVSERLLRIEPTEPLRVVWREPFKAVLCANDAEVGRGCSPVNSGFLKLDAHVEWVIGYECPL